MTIQNLQLPNTQKTSNLTMRDLQLPQALGKSNVSREDLLYKDSQVYQDNKYWLRPGETPEQYKQRTQPVSLDTTEAPMPPTFEPTQRLEDNNSLQAQLERQRQDMEKAYQTQLEDFRKRTEEQEKIQQEAQKKQEGILGQLEPETTPFRQDLETRERERLQIEQNYFANQQLTNELDKLLTESTNLTRQLSQQKVPGLAGLQQSERMTKAQETAQSRIAVIEAVMSARNNQIGVGLGFIDRSLNNIQQDRQDRIDYLNSVYKYYQETKDDAGNKIFNLSKQEEAMINKQIGLLEADYQRAEATAQRIKDLMLENPQMVAEAGISLNDTEEEISKKLADWQYTTEVRDLKNELEGKGVKELTQQQALNKPQDQIFTYIDSKGVNRYFEMPTEWQTTMVDGSLYRVDPKTGKTELLVYSPPKGTGGGLGGGVSGSDFAPATLTDEQIRQLDARGLELHQMDIVAGIMNGSQPPITSIQRTPEITKILGGLSALGYDNTKAVQDWTAMQKRLASMNSTQQLRLSQAVFALDGSTDQAEQLYKEWQATGLPTGFSNWNRAALETASRLPGEAGVAARTLVSHIEDMAAELAVIYRGGNSPTDQAFEAARKSLNEDWNPSQFAKNLELIRQNIRIRKNSIANSSQIAGNIYNPTIEGEVPVFQNDDDIFNESLMGIEAKTTTTPAVQQVTGWWNKFWNSF
jgi:hypothetical protein